MRRVQEQMVALGCLGDYAAEVAQTWHGVACQTAWCESYLVLCLLAAFWSEMYGGSKLLGMNFSMSRKLAAGAWVLSALW